MRGKREARKQARELAVAEHRPVQPGAPEYSEVLEPDLVLPANVSPRTLAAAGTIIDRAQQLQQPAVSKYVNRIRRKYPDDNPAQIITRLERRYLNTVTSTGSAVGATAAVPGIGTFTALGAMTAETAFFIEASALLALAVAEVHGIHPHDVERRRALVLAVALGEEGVMAVGRLVGTRSLKAISGATGTNLTALNRALTNKVIKKYALKKSGTAMGKMLPGGIGAVIGGIGNRALGNSVLRNSRKAFGPAPLFWTSPIRYKDDELPVAGAPEIPRTRFRWGLGAPAIPQLEAPSQRELPAVGSTAAGSTAAGSAPGSNTEDAGTPDSPVWPLPTRR